MFGLVLAGVSAPRLYAALLLLPASPVLSDIRNGVAVDDSDLQIIIDRNASAQLWQQDGSVKSDRALALMILAEHQNRGSAQYAQTMAEARQSLEESLLRRPLSPFVWVRYALLLQRMDAPREDVASALKTSMLIGRFEPKLLQFRTAKALQVVDAFDEEGRRLLADQVRIIWDEQARVTWNKRIRDEIKGELQKAVLKTGTQDFVRGALVNHVADLTELESFLQPGKS